MSEINHEGGRDVKKKGHTRTALIGEMKNSYKVLVRRVEGIRQLGNRGI
jgi:hypothetical protein